MLVAEEVRGIVSLPTKANVCGAAAECKTFYLDLASQT